MTQITDHISDGFSDLQSLLETTASFDGEDIDIVEGEGDEIAEVVMGGIEEEITGVVIALKEDFSTLPEVGDTFSLGDKTCRIISIKKDNANPLLSIAYNLGEI